MTLIESKQDLFQDTENYYYAHCVSADFALGAGIAVQFDKRYNMRWKLIRQYPSGGIIPSCVRIDKVFNLVTKDKYWNKPTYDSLRESLIDMRLQVERHMVKRIAMPKIGCGLDRLQWDKVKEIIEDVFKDMNIEILVCYL